MKFRSIFTALLVLSAFSVRVFAQNHVILTDYQHVGQAPSPACVREGEAFIKIASQYPQPTNWTFYIVCTERSWYQFLKKSGQLKHGVLVDGVVYKNNPRVLVYGTTYLGSHVTYLRGDKLTHPDPWMSPDHIVAHEIAHIVLASSNEQKVDHQALEWVAEHQQTGAPVTITADTLAENNAGSR